jgi:hypothetical protein
MIEEGTNVDAAGAEEKTKREEREEIEDGASESEMENCGEHNRKVLTK